MLKKYYLMSGDNQVPVGILTMDVEQDFFSFEKNIDYDGLLPFFLKYTNNSMTPSERVKLWITERAPEPNYTFIDALIEKAGLKEYDPFGFFEFNKGAFNTDDFHVVPI